MVSKVAAALYTYTFDELASTRDENTGSELAAYTFGVPLALTSGRVDTTLD